MFVVKGVVYGGEINESLLIGCLVDGRDFELGYVYFFVENWKW